MQHNSAARHLHAVHDAHMSPTEGFESYLRANNCGDNTVHYRLAHVADFARHHPAFPNVTPADVTNWLGRLGYKPWSRTTFYGHLRSYFGWAAQSGIVAADPMGLMRRPRAPKGTPRPLSSQQVDAVMAAANPTVHAWLVLALFAGLRAHEVAKVRASDVEADRLFVCGKGGKSVYLPTHPAVWALAQTMPREGWWFPARTETGHVTARYVSAVTCELFAACGVEGGVHRLRHTYATRLLRAGVNIKVVQELMRHSSLSSTEVYLAVSSAECRDAINLLAAA